MPNYELHNQLKQLSGSVYKNGEPPRGYVKISTKENQKTGFYADVYSKGNEMVVVFRGTDMNLGKKEGGKDLFNDAQMIGQKLPSQVVDARKLYSEVKKGFPNSKIILTGHSLGGSVGQALGAETGAETVTFGAYGIANTHSPIFLNTNNITNYGNADDIVFASNIDNQLGKTFIIDDKNSDSDYLIKSNQKNEKKFSDTHFIEKMGDITTAKEYRGGLPQNDETQLFKMGIDKNVDYRDIDPNRIIANEEVGDMTSDEFARNEEFINQQMKNGKILPKAEAERRLQAGDLVWVNPYKRDDGTEVKGYYRAR